MPGADKTIASLRRMITMQARMDEDMEDANLIQADPAENAFIAEELDHNREFRALLERALAHVEAGEIVVATPLIEDIRALSQKSAWAESALLHEFMATYAD